MRRVVEKVKDIVEICPFTQLQDFAADPSLTLASYHFTDITADLMSQWIDRAASVRTGNGAALALAGFRGVGKSHFLSVIGAIAGRPELRSRISDPHVATSAERLPRRHGSVAFVRRGTGMSLLDELKRAVSPLLEMSPAALGDSIYDLLLRADEASGESPLLLLIDTALGRESRVSRDDGVALSEIGEAAKAIGVFVGVALDDDISGADGPNASISGTFGIDYLDQEHLYRIVDSAIFSKQNQMRPLLHDIYEDYRAELPGFRWSEQRFSSLYPLHPATVEIAPLVRLYIQDFALLGFAADAGMKILGRPAHSLIGLEEVFDGTESRLRSTEELAPVFAAFDCLEREVVAKVPVLSRHPAKLVLKGLLLLSLGGEGATADEIAASMMITGAHSLDVAALLESFAAGAGDGIVRRTRPNGNVAYGFRLAGKVDVDTLVAEASRLVPDTAIGEVLRTQFAERFAGFEQTENSSACAIAWRGGVRRGYLVWPPAEVDSDGGSSEAGAETDFTVRVGRSERDESGDPETVTDVHWELAPLSSDEEECLRRHYVLCRDAEVRRQLADGLGTAVRLSSIAIERIWTRVMFNDARLRFGGSEYPILESASGSHTLAQLLSQVLTPVLDEQFPSHPLFHEQLEAKQLELLIGEFLCGNVSSGPGAQRAAQIFAVPLGLASGPAGLLHPTPADDLVALPLIQAVVETAASESEIGLSEISRGLRSAPFGLTREAQRLVMAALVAQRQFDFVTSKGDRINYRSLDLQIIWDDIVGIAKPLNELYSSERLVEWARLLTGNAGLKSIDRSDDRLLVIDSLASWLSGWTSNRVLGDFDSLPDEMLSAGIWRTATNLRKSFGAMADIIESLVRNDITLDTCLQSIADLFSDSEQEYESKKLDLRVLQEFNAGVRKRSEIVGYLSLCERTQEPSIEEERLALIAQLSDAHGGFSPKAHEDTAQRWTSFRHQYSTYYATHHDRVMKSGGHGETLKEIIRSDEWAVFESLAGSPAGKSDHFALAKNLIRELRQLQCSSDVSQVLAERPFCGCSFSLSDADRLARLAEDLAMAVKLGIDSVIQLLLEKRELMLASAESGAMRSSVGAILDRLADGIAARELTSQEIRVLRLTLGNAETAAIAPAPSSSHDAMDESLEIWETEVLSAEDFVNTEIKM